MLHWKMLGLTTAIPMALSTVLLGCNSGAFDRRATPTPERVTPPMGRYQVVSGKAHGVMAPVDVVIKIDTQTGETWMACWMDVGWGWCKMSDGAWVSRGR